MWAMLRYPLLLTVGPQTRQGVRAPAERRQHFSQAVKRHGMSLCSHRPVLIHRSCILNAKPSKVIHCSHAFINASGVKITKGKHTAQRHKHPFKHPKMCALIKT